MLILKYFQKADAPKHEYKVSEGDSGIDLKAALYDNIIIPPGSVRLVPTNLYLDIQDGYEAQVRSRSGLAYKNRVFVLNSPGTIDQNYRGEVGIILANFSDNDFTVRNGDRIAQMVIMEVPKVILKPVMEYEDLGTSKRGSNGFGSTGI